MNHSRRLNIPGWSLTRGLFKPSLSILFICSLSGSLAIASSNNVSTSCAAGDINMDPIPLPVSSQNNTNSGADKLDTTVCLAASAFTDGVKCFTPENSCNIKLTGRGEDNDGTANDGATRVAIAAGACFNTPSSCTGSGTTNIISSYAVTAGTQYCFYVETTVDQQIGYTLESAEMSNCGNMPVQLQHFSIE